MRIFMRVVGPIVFLVGVVFCISGMAAFFSYFSAFGSTDTGYRMPTNIWHWFVGIPLAGVGGVMIKFGYLRPVTRYIADETSDSVSKFSKAFRGGGATYYCRGCGTGISHTSNFCSHCGVEKI